MVALADALRFLSLLVAVAHVLFAVTLLRWYMRAKLVTPARGMHVASVGLGWILAEVQMAGGVVASFGEPFEMLRAPLLLAANLFVFLGTLALYRRARACEGGKLEDSPR